MSLLGGDPPPIFQGIRAPWRHVCGPCEYAWQDFNSGESACEFCGQPARMTNETLHNSVRAPAPHWTLPDSDDDS